MEISERDLWLIAIIFFARVLLVAVPVIFLIGLVVLAIYFGLK